MRQNRLKSTFRALLWVGLFLPAIALTHCSKLKDHSPKAEVFPENGATDVPVNVVVEVQYPKELGIKDEQMKYGLFSIRECESDNFAYFKPPEAPAATTTSSNENTSANAAPVKNADGTTTPAKTDANEKTANGVQTKYKADIKFFHSHIADSTSRVFNYLIVNPEDRTTPLKPNTTYCVQTKKLVNDQNITIEGQETRFTTEESPSLEFDTKVDVEYFGDRLTMAKGADGKTLPDFVLLNLRGQAVRPSQLKGQVKLCLETTDKTLSTEACKDFGKEVASDIYMVESLQNDSNQRTISHYDLYAVRPRQELVKGQQYKIVVNLDVAKNEETNIGMDPSNVIEVDDEATPHWMGLFKNDIKDANGNSVFTEKAKFFYVGSGS